MDGWFWVTHLFGGSGGGGGGGVCKKKVFKCLLKMNKSNITPKLLALSPHSSVSTWLKWEWKSWWKESIFCLTFQWSFLPVRWVGWETNSPNLQIFWVKTNLTVGRMDETCNPLFLYFFFNPKTHTLNSDMKRPSYFFSSFACIPFDSYHFFEHVGAQSRFAIMK